MAEGKKDEPGLVRPLFPYLNYIIVFRLSYNLKGKTYLSLSQYFVCVLLSDGHATIFLQISVAIIS